MIRKSRLRGFLNRNITSHFDGFFLHDDQWLIRTTSHFLHGILFERSGVGDDFYVNCFLDFLPTGHDFIGLTIGERVRRCESHKERPTVFYLEPAEYETEQIVKAVHASRFYPHIVSPSCRSLLEAFDTKLDTVWVNFGLGCCALLENEPARAMRLLSRFDEVMVRFDNENARRAHQLYLDLSTHIDSPGWCRDFLRERTEEGIRSRKLEKIAELSQWEWR